MDRDANAVLGGRQENVRTTAGASRKCPIAESSQFQFSGDRRPAPLGQAVNTKKEMKTARASAAPAPSAKPVAGYAGATSMMEEVAVSNPRLIAAAGFA